MHKAQSSASALPSSFTAPHRSSHRRSSSNSFSSASVVTARRTSSVSIGTRNPAASSLLPGFTEPAPLAPRSGHESLPTEHHRRKSSAVDLSGSISAFENRQTVEQWSRSAAPPSTRNRASSGAILPPIIPQQPISLGGVPSSSFGLDSSPPPRASPSRNRQSSSRTRRSPSTSPIRHPHTHNLEYSTASFSALPPLHTTPGLTDPNDEDSPSTIPTIPTPSGTQGHALEYFHSTGPSPRSSMKPRQTTSIRAGGTISAVSRKSEVVTVAAREPPQMNGSVVQQGADRSNNGYSQSSYDATTTNAARRTPGNARGEQDKKTLLSKALAKANTAVLLDNAENFESALAAYDDACDLLQRVMDRSSAVEDRRKLDLIRVTYTNRIEELRQMQPVDPLSFSERSLPEPPPSDVGSSPARSPLYPSESYLTDSTVEQPSAFASDTYAPVLHLVGDNHSDFQSETNEAMERLNRGRTDRDGGNPVSDFPPQYPTSLNEQSAAQPAHYNVRNRDSGVLEAAPTGQLQLPPPTQAGFMPRPLSPRRPSASEESGYGGGAASRSQASQEHSDAAPDSEHSRVQSNASPALLDTIDESGPSSRSSSVHSTGSRRIHHRRPIHSAIMRSDPDFDAAFDAAVEAAYDEGFEPDLDSHSNIEPASRRHMPSASVAVLSSDIEELWRPTDYTQSDDAERAGKDQDAQAAEEESILDAATQHYAQKFTLDADSSTSLLPRQSDSSGYSRSTWQSSSQSDRTTAGTSLSTVTEDAIPQRLTPKIPNTPSPASSSIAEMPPPTKAPPPLPILPLALPQLPGIVAMPSPGVRSRRLSGQNMRQLKIETTSTASSKSGSRTRASTYHAGQSPHREEHDSESPGRSETVSVGDVILSEEVMSADTEHQRMLQSPPSLTLLTTVSDDSRPMTARTTPIPSTAHEHQDDDDVGESLTLRPSLFRKNKSSISLREHTVLLSPIEPIASHNIATPMSSTFMQYGVKRMQAGPLTSQRANFPALSTTISEGQANSVNLFDTSLSLSAKQVASPRSPPGVPAPVQLEPCPESFLLRPFWLMRAILATITHPKGGFITTRLFVPHDVWQTAGVKLKSIEDKVANCDLLTAALGRLALVDPYDADAIMEELQSFEEVMERVQAVLAKKLGNDVGIHSASNLFKDAPPPSAAPDAAPGVESKTKSKENKSGYLNSWRKLRNKNSAGAGGSGNTNAIVSGAAREATAMPSVPMTNYVPVERRGTPNRRHIRSLVFDGPHSEYMGSVARLFEGVQALDQIARQVEDPGLRGTSPTHVGLELSIRHASEFFAFYICRFVLADLNLLLEKFLKRGSEWVLT